jgi:hypothetical protein
MATYYARANLNDLNDATGYSLTSGGPSAGVRPSGSTELIIFDQNSGPTRTISGSCPGMYGSPIDMSTGNPMNFTSSLTLTGSSTLKGTALGVTLSGINQSAGASPYSLDASQCLIGTGGLYMIYSPVYWSLIGGIFTTAGAITIPSSGSDQSVLYAQNMTLTCASIYAPYTPAKLSLGTGGTTIVITGAGAASGTSSVVTLGDNAVNSGGFTLVLTDTGPYIKPVDITVATPFNFTNNTGNGQGTGGVSFIRGGSTFATFDAGKGAVTTFLSSYAYTAANWILDGAGQYNQIKSSSTTTATLTKSGGGTVAANFCSFSYLTVSGSPLTTIRATNSKMASCTGITLVGQTSRTMVFL